MEKASIVWRLFQLLLLIDEKPGMSAGALAEHCELSLRTIYRYIDHLRMAGVPIVTDRGYRMTQELSLKGVNLTLAQAFSLISAGRHLSSGQSPFDSKLKEALEKIVAILPAGLRESALQASDHILMGQEPAVDYSKTWRIFNLVQQAVNDRKVLVIDYRALTADKVGRRRVDPYGMIFRQGFWYLAARCHRRDENLLFRLDRITELETTALTFELPADFSLSEYMRDAWQVVRGEAREVKVCFSGLSRRIVLEGTWHPSQEVLEDTGDRVVLSFKVGGLREIAVWLLGFGGEVAVLEPAELRQLVCEIATAAAAANR